MNKLRGDYSTQLTFIRVFLDFGFLDFEPRRTERKINYNPLNISKKELTNKIIQFSKIDFYLKKTKIYS